MTEVDNQPPAPEEQQRIKNEASWVELLKSEMGRVIVGQKYLVDRLIIGLLANGHVLLEGVPGLAKTLAVKTLSQCLRADFKRIQFTPDLLPADVLGTLIYSPAKGEFTNKKGPIFTNLLLADEINRAPAKVQSALLEAMQERQVTIGDETYPLPQPFLVLATENPIDQEGTYPLPEAQMDRFMLKLVVNYPDREDELRILNANANVSVSHEVNPVVDAETIFKSRKLVDGIYLDDMQDRKRCGHPVVFHWHRHRGVCLVHAALLQSGAIVPLHCSCQRRILMDQYACDRMHSSHAWCELPVSYESWLLGFQEGWARWDRH